MSVVNCRVKYIRPKYQDLREWIADPENVYIGRGRIVYIDGERFPPENSLFANPFKISQGIPASVVIQKFREYVENRIQNEPNFKSALLALKGKTLGCWCAPEPCHGNILLELIQKYSE